MKFIKGLTGLRAYAALFVYAAHMYHFNHFGLPPWWRSFLTEFGPAGVSLFFVLSGFVLAINYPYDTMDSRRFYVARIARIYPAYFIGIVLAVPLEVFSPAKDNHAMSFFANLFMIQQFFPSTAGTFNDVGWTLCVEAFFYLLFPIITVLIIRGSLRRSLLLGLAALLFSVASVSLMFPNFFGTYHFPPNRLFEFLLGTYAGLFYVKHSKLQLNNAILRLLFLTGAVLFIGFAAIGGSLKLFSMMPQLFWLLDDLSG